MNFLLESRDIYEQKARNKRWTTLVILVFIALLGLLGAGFDYLIAMGGTIQTIEVPVIIYLAGSLLIKFVNGISRRFAFFAPDAERDFDLPIEEENRKVYLLLFKFTIVCMVILVEMAVWETPPVEFQLFHFENTFRIGTMAAFVIGAVVALSTLHWGADSILHSLGATHADPSNDREHQLLDVVDEMKIAAGIPAPEIYVLHDGAPNAFAIGRSPKHASIVVTQGLLDLLDRDELQGVIAHEMSHIKNYDIRLKTVITALFGSVMLFSDGARRYTMFSGIPKANLAGLRGMFRPILTIVWVAALLAAPVIARMLVVLVSRHREYLADASGAELTRNPLGLAKALGKIQSAAEPDSTLKRNVSHLCIIDPVDKPLNSGENFLGDVFATHPPTQKRILFLKSMSYEPMNAPISRA
ncbi:MAG TPA: M48 family metalloprotease [Bacteroidota bacterium]|nr:M48 family metalloprotease [Bacteroidota bacterium]